MHNRNSILNFAKVVGAVVPVNLATAAVNGPYASMRNCEVLHVIIIKGAGTAGEDPVITLTQATTAAGGSAKTLNITAVQHQIAANVTLATAFVAGVNVSSVEISRETSVASYATDLIDAAENQAMFVLTIHKDDLDDDFAFVRCNIADVGASSQLAAMIYIAGGLKHAGRNTPAFNA